VKLLRTSDVGRSHEVRQHGSSFIPVPVALLEVM